MDLRLSLDVVWILTASADGPELSQETGIRSYNRSLPFFFFLPNQLTLTAKY